jgi:hypothetical protein
MDIRTTCKTLLEVETTRINSRDDEISMVLGLAIFPELDVL